MAGDHRVRAGRDWPSGASGPDGGGEVRAASERPGARRLLSVGTSCGCPRAWYQRLVSGVYSVLGCPRHSSAGSDWTARTTSFKVIADVPHETVEMCEHEWV